MPYNEKNVKKEQGYGPVPSVLIHICPNYDLYHFPKKRIQLKRQRLDSIEEVQAKLQWILNSMKSGDFLGGFQKWENRIQAQGNFVERVGGIQKLTVETSRIVGVTQRQVHVSS